MPKRKSKPQLLRELGVAVIALKHIAIWEVKNLEADPSREPSFPGRVVAEALATMAEIEKEGLVHSYAPKFDGEDMKYTIVKDPKAP